MSEITTMAEEIFNKRQEKLKKLEEEKKSKELEKEETVERLVRLVLNLFKESDEEIHEEEKIIRGIRFSLSGKSYDVVIFNNYNLSSGDKRETNYSMYPHTMYPHTKNAIDEINKLNPTKEIIELAIEYVKKNLSEFFYVEETYYICIRGTRKKYLK